MDSFFWLLTKFFPALCLILPLLLKAVYIQDNVFHSHKVITNIGFIGFLCNNFDFMYKICFTFGILNFN